MLKSTILGPNGKPIRRVKNHYEGAGQGPRLKHWQAPATGPKQILRGNLTTLRNRTRAAFRNSLLLRATVKKNTSAEIGKGIAVQSDCEDLDFKQQANNLWLQTAQALDPEGQLDFNGKLTQSVLNRRMSGEVFLLKKRLSKASQLPTHFQIDCLEADYCPIGYNRKGKGRRRIIDGIEFLSNKRVAYWFYPEHPGDGGASREYNLVRVKAEDVIHHYIPTRVGQIRGEPDAVSALLKNHMFAEYDDNELNRKRNRSAFTRFIAQEDYSEEDCEFDPLTGQNLHDNGTASIPSEVVVPGRFV